jgi:ureidoacrylate peracid hydrolase
MPELDLDPARTALLVVDLQNDFCSPGGFFERAGHDIGPTAAVVPRVAELAARARAAGVPVVYTMTVRDEPQVQKLRPARHPADGSGERRGNDRYLRGAWGTEIADGVRPQPGDLVVEKPRQSGFHRTSLEELLRERGVTTLAVTGVTTNCCVDTTVRDAYMRDFDVLVLADAVAAFGAERHLHDATLENIALFFGVVAPSDAFLAVLP